jgi:hypothetical protein
LLRFDRILGVVDNAVEFVEAGVDAFVQYSGTYEARVHEFGFRDQKKLWLPGRREVLLVVLLPKQDNGSFFVGDPWPNRELEGS